MKRRDFLRQLGLGLAATWASTRLSWPPGTPAADVPELRLALLADAHLKNGKVSQPTARHLARAVTEIRSLLMPPDLVLFAGDLAHLGRPDALDLGREILSDLPAPLLLVRGEGDGAPDENGPWRRRFGEPRFSYAYRGVRLLGLDTTLNQTSRSRAFGLGQDQLNWLSRELAALDPATPLVILSHAPLSQIFYPWQQWTTEAPEVLTLLSRFRSVLCVHGHVHCGGHLPGTVAPSDAPPPLAKRDEEAFFTPTLANSPRREGELQTSGNSAVYHQGLPSTSWPRPQAVIGTPANRPPGLGPRGCGWARLTFSPDKVLFQPHLWQA